MNTTLSDWTLEQVEARFVEAAKTSRHLPAVRMLGYASAWPALQRMALVQPLEDNRSQRIHPSPAAVDRMLEATRWMLWLDQDSRHLVWMRADRRDWQEICRRFGCNRTTAWRRWKKALQIVADQLTDDCK